MAAPLVSMLPMNALAPEIAKSSPILIGEVSVTVAGPFPHAAPTNKVTTPATAAARRRCDLNLDSPFSMTPSGPVQAALRTNPGAPQKNRADVVSLDLSRRPLEVIASVDQQVDPVRGIEREIDVLLDDDDRGSARRDAFDLLPNDLRVSRRQPGSGLVEQHDCRVEHQRPRNAKQVSLTAAERSGALHPGLAQIRKDLEHLADPLFDPMLARVSAHLEVLDDGEARKDVRHLRHVAETASRDLVRGQAGDLLGSHPHRAAGEAQLAGQRLHERRLARTV